MADTELSPERVEETSFAASPFDDDLWLFARYCVQTAIASERLAEADSYVSSIALMDDLARMLEASDLGAAQRLRGVVATHDRLLRENAELRAATALHPKDEWHEDFGNALWWFVPISEPPYAGTPLDDDFPEYVTHWSRVVYPDEPAALTSGPSNAK